MKFRGYSFMGTLVAIIAIVIVVLLSKFVFNEEKIEEKVIIPTEEETLKFIENTQFGALPTE